MADDKTIHTGMIAQELEPIYPYAVETEPWGEVEVECQREEAIDKELSKGDNEELKPKYRKKDDKYYRLEPKYDEIKRIDYKRLVPLLIKSVQELEEKVVKLERRI